MNAEQELVFAKYLVKVGLAGAPMIKSCLRAQATSAAQGQQVSLGEVLVERGHLSDAVVREHLRHFTERLRACGQCTVFFYAEPGWDGANCRRCSATGDGRGTGLTGQFRRAQRGSHSSGRAAAQPREAERGPAPDEPVKASEPQVAETFGSYEILESVAKGGMGVVYKARHVTLGRVVALKVLREGQRHSESHVKRFKREARSVAKLHHPNVVQIHEFGYESGQYFFTMDFVEGSSLDAFLGDPHRDLRRGVELVRDAANGLVCSHENGVIHRDIKPANILIEVDGVAKLTDFGLARNSENNSKLTQEGELIGTPLYMAPEQVRGRVTEIDARSDLYSLGVVLYQHLTGRLPFLAKTMIDLQYKILNEEPPDIRDANPKVDGQLDRVVRKCLEKERDDRYQTAQALVDDLERWLKGERVVARAPSMQGRLVRKIRRNKHAFAGIVVLACGLVLGGGYFAYHEWSSQARQRSVERKQALTELETSLRATVNGAEASLAQAAAELRGEARSEQRSKHLKAALDVLRGVKVDLDLALALTPDELTPAEVADLQAVAGLTEVRQRWHLLSAEAEYEFQDAGSLERARAHLEALVERGHATPAAWMLLAQVRRDLGDDAGAEAAARKVLEATPNDPSALRLQGELSFAAGRLPVAVAQLGAALEGLHPDQRTEDREAAAALLLLRARAHRKLGQVSEEAADLEKARGFAPNEAEVYVLRGQMWHARGERFRAAQDFDRAVELSDQDAVAPHLARGRFLLDQGYYQRALDDLRAAVDANDALVEGYLWRGLAAYLGLQLDEAARDLELVADSDDADQASRLEALSRLGRLRRASGDAAAAQDAYAAALAIDPSHYPSLIGLGRARIDAGRPEDARDVIEQALAVHEGAEALLASGLVALAIGDLEAAASALDRAVGGGPVSVESLAARAHLNERRGDEEAARRDYRASLLARPADPDVRAFFRDGRRYLELARATETPLQRSHDLGRAQHAFELCVQLAPLHARAHVERARALELLGEPARAAAITACDDALAANPYALEAYRVRARLRLATGLATQLEEAVRDVEAAFRHGADEAVDFRLLGEAQLAADDAKAAVASLATATKRSPGDARGFELLAAAARAAGATAQADKAAARAVELRGGARERELADVERRAGELRSRKPDEAVRLLSDEISRAPRLGRLYLERSRAELSRRAPQPAVRDLSRAIELDPLLGSHMFESLGAITAGLDWNEAFRLAEQAQRSGRVEDVRSGAFLTGFLYVLRIESGGGLSGDALKGVELLTRVLDDDPTSASAHYLRGLLMLRSDDLGAAVKDLRTALRLEPGAAVAHVFLAGVFAQRKSDLLALETLKKAIANGFTDRAHLERDPALAPLRLRTAEWRRAVGAD